MNLFQFLDIKYQEVAVSLGVEYSVFKDGRAKAIHMLIGVYRSTSKWLSVPILIAEFALMKTGFKPEPIPPVRPLPPEKPKIVAQTPVSSQNGHIGDVSK